jgi:hypothetical protein
MQCIAQKLTPKIAFDSLLTILFGWASNALGKAICQLLGKPIYWERPIYWKSNIVAFEADALHHLFVLKSARSL